MPGRPKGQIGPRAGRLGEIPGTGGQPVSDDVHMKDYGPWLVWGWCPQCRRETEQTRTHRREIGAPAQTAQVRITCTECSTQRSPAE